MMQLSPMPPARRSRQRSTPPILPRARSSDTLERNLFLLALALALTCVVGATARAMYLGRRVANMERELERQNVSIREGESQCGATTVSTVCDPGWRDARRHDMEQWSASTNDARAERDQWNEWGVFGGLACIGLFYGMRLVLTGRIRPLWPLSS